MIVEFIQRAVLLKDQCFHGFQVRNTDAAMRSFKEEVARLLQVEPYEEQIRERIGNLIMGSRDKGSVSTKP